MKNLTPAMTLLVSAVLFSGCSTATHYLSEGGKARDGVDASKVKIYSAEKIDMKYDVIGSVAVDLAGDSDEAATLLKKEAGSIGANAVINTRLTKMHSHASSRTGLSGTAVWVH